MEKFIFYLYIAGSGEIFEKAESDLKRFCEEEIRSEYEIFIVDIIKDPYVIEDLKLIAIPTLIKKSQGKEIRMVGDFSDKTQLMQILELEKIYG